VPPRRALRPRDNTAPLIAAAGVCRAPRQVSTFWLVFPHLNPSSGRTPLWSVLPSLFMSVIGAGLWKWWESAHPQERSVSLAMPGGYGGSGRTTSVTSGGRSVSKDGAAHALLVDHSGEYA
jgi:hypothetical protein